MLLPQTRLGSELNYRGYAILILGVFKIFTHSSVVFYTNHIR